MMATRKAPKPTTKPDVCLSCMAEVVWVDDTKAGNWKPMNVDGTPHKCKETP